VRTEGLKPIAFQKMFVQRILISARENFLEKEYQKNAVCCALWYQFWWKFCLADYLRRNSNLFYQQFERNGI